ncbi:MAG: hypothetical protein HOK28_16385 [Deltaproteobacteria bacterium]|jgi:DNA-binding beta-propeller fold protein YncE|nr:hypothetical protein [Deltaproteobacteria bacterium]
MKNILGLILLALLALPGCGDGPNACNEGNFCEVNESGNAACIDGYEWLNASADDDFRCKEKTYLPVLGDGKNTTTAVQLTVVGTSADGLNVPRDLEFHPNVPGQLWVVNRGDESIVIYSDMGQATQSDQKKKAGFAEAGQHFLAQPAAISFGANGNFSTIHETDQLTQGAATPEDFMGPTMWTSDLAFFNAGHSGHLDMMHNTPLGMGIAWETGNVYWVFDGYHSSITRYDFVDDHGLGGSDHSDGIVSRYVQGNVKRSADIVSHMEIDHATGLLYIADTGNNRIAVLDTKTGTKGSNLTDLNYDCSEYICPDYHYVDGVNFSELISGTDQGMSKPSGLALHGDHVYVSDFATGMIYGFTKEGKLLDWLDTGRPNALSGMDFDSDGSLYVTDKVANEILRIQAL